MWDIFKRLAPTQWMLPAAEEVFQDLRYGGRVLRRSPGLTVVAGLTLALAIAATTSVFAVVDAVLLAPLPFGRSEQLCVLYEHLLPQRAPRVSVTPGTFMEWQDRAHAFTAFTAIDIRQQPAILGRPVTLDDHSYIVIGVMPAGFMFPDPSAQAWVPMPMTAAERESRGSHSLFAVARLRDKVTIADAANDLHGVATTLRQLFPASNGDWDVTVVPAREDMVGKTGDVVGVVGDVRHFGAGAPVTPEMYWAAAQIDAVPSETLRRMRRGLTLVVSTAGDPLAVGPPVKAAVGSVDPTQPAVAGIVAGVLLAVAIGRTLTWLLDGVGPTDIGTLGVVAAVLTAATMCACWIPARRAARLNPMDILRVE